MSIVDMLSPTWVYAHFWTTRSQVVEALRGHRVVRIAMWMFKSREMVTVSGWRETQWAKVMCAQGDKGAQEVGRGAQWRGRRAEARFKGAGSRPILTPGLRRAVRQHEQPCLRRWRKRTRLQVRAGKKGWGPLGSQEEWGGCGVVGAGSGLGSHSSGGDKRPGCDGCHGRLAYKSCFSRPKLCPTPLGQHWYQITRNRTLETIYIKPFNDKKKKKGNLGLKRIVQIQKDRTRIQISCCPNSWFTWQTSGGSKPHPLSHAHPTNIPSSAHIGPLVQPCGALWVPQTWANLLSQFDHSFRGLSRDLLCPFSSKPTKTSGRVWPASLDV